ncbi:MAG: accessory factor UbiK family protein [Gammaproteobacteria bacterium]|nr:accessory factor UbiK family protein [Gammaproteobacteria bacterium]
MPKADFLKNLSDHLTQAFPEHLSTFKKDFEKNCHRILTNAFAKLDLVTREEFDTQTKVLIRTRKKLEALEKEMKTIEALLKNNKKHL